jgi:hypothetical protein
MEPYLFWRKAMQRRWISILLALSWPLYGVLMMFLIRAWTGKVDETWMLATFASWFVIAWRVNRWVDQLKCPRCGKTPFGRNSFWVPTLRCQHCRLTEGDGWRPPAGP